MGIIHLEINLDGDDYKATDVAREGREVAGEEDGGKAGG